MLLLGVALVVGQILEKNRIDWMSEAGGALIIGVVLGLTVNLATNMIDYENLFKFNVRTRPPSPTRQSAQTSGLPDIIYALIRMQTTVCVQTDFFFIFLLPPIIFDAAFNLEVAPCVAPCTSPTEFPNLYCNILLLDATPFYLCCRWGHQPCPY